MSPVIVAACPCCRSEVERAPSDVTLLFCDDDQTLSTYSFDCMWCGPQIKAAPDCIARLLLGAGVPTQAWCVDVDLSALLGAA